VAGTGNGNEFSKAFYHGDNDTLYIIHSWFLQIKAGPFTGDDPGVWPAVIK